MKTYETYGFGKIIDPSRIITDLTPRLNKPKSAWWGSPVDGDFTWKEWCLGEQFKSEGYFSDNNKCTWTLKSTSKIYSIEDLGDVYSLKDHGYFINRDYDKILNFELLKKDGYTAIELCDSCIGHIFHDKYEMSFNSWDCESIVVLDPKNIIWL